ncbi:MAG: hypothetical protein RO469_06410 [Thermincola sp.]|nr:hypothetical protein [Thermincola sp.]
MFKIKDRVTLGVVAGLAGNLVKSVIDEVSTKKKISQRSFRGTAAGAWVSKKESTNINGQILGGLLDFGMGSLGGVGSVYLLSKTGKDHLVTKGLLSGITMGSLITFALAAVQSNKAKPKDAASNLSYMVSHAAYGLVTTFVAAKLGDQSVYDVKPQNNNLEPTRQTTEQASSSLKSVKSDHRRTQSQGYQ